jgi:hypothetical protein
MVDQLQNTELDERIIEGDLSNYCSVSKGPLITCFLDEVDLEQLRVIIGQMLTNSVNDPKVFALIGLALIAISFPQNLLAAIPNSSRKGRKLGGDKTYEEFRKEFRTVNSEKLVLPQELPVQRNTDSLFLFIMQAIFGIVLKTFEKKEIVETKQLTKLQMTKNFIKSINIIDLITVIILLAILALTGLTYYELKNRGIASGEISDFGPNPKPDIPPKAIPSGGPIQSPILAPLWPCTNKRAFLEVNKHPLFRKQPQPKVGPSSLLKRERDRWENLRKKRNQPKKK